MTIINAKYTYEKLEQITFEDGSRYYVSPEKNNLYSVTTILGATSEKPELEAWKKRVGLNEAEKIRTEATNIGSMMHDHLEKYILNEERPKGNNLIRVMARKMADTIIEHGLSNVEEVWGIEQVLYIENQYAGTADLIGTHEGVPAIMDYKTTKRPKSRKQVEDYSLQLAAYADAHNTMLGTDINKGVIFMSNREGEYIEFVFEGDEFEALKVEWRKRVQTYLNT